MANFHELCRIGNLKDVEDAVKSGVELNVRDYVGRTGLMFALWNKHTEVATMLVQNPAVDVNIAKYGGRCALHIASQNDENSDCLALILAREDLTTVNNQNKNGSTPLMFAIRNRATRCMEVLLSEDRTDPNLGIFATEGVSFSPIMVAVKSNFVPELELLLADRRVDLQTRDDYRRTGEEIDR